MRNNINQFIDNREQWRRDIINFSNIDDYWYTDEYILNNQQETIQARFKQCYEHYCCGKLRKLFNSYAKYWNDGYLFYYNLIKKLLRRIKVLKF